MLTKACRRGKAGEVDSRLVGKEGLKLEVAESRGPRKREKYNTEDFERRKGAGESRIR